MPRIRTVKPEFFSHEGLAALPFAARLLAIGLLQIADGEGRMRWIPKQIEAHVFPFDVVDLDALATGLEGAGFLLRYGDGTRLYATIPNFGKHQRITGREASYESKIPAPDACASAGNTGETPECFPGKQVGAQEQGNRGTGEEEQDLFVASEPRPADPIAQVWEHYLSRRKVRREINDTARRLIKALLKSKRTVEQIGLVVDWSHNAPSSAHLRENDRGTDFTRWSTVFAKANFDKYIEMAEAWKAGGSKAPTNPSGLTKEQQTRVRIANDALWGTYEDYWREKGDRSRPYVRADLDAAMSKSPANAKQYAAMPEWLKDEWVMRIERIRTHVRRVS